MKSKILVLCLLISAMLFMISCNKTSVQVHSVESVSKHVCDFNMLKANESCHWYECNCGMSNGYGEHSGGVPNCQNKAVCSTCWRTYGDITRHSIGDGECLICGKKESQGLEYELSGDCLSYTVVGIGDCEDVVLIIPATYNNLPVEVIGSNAFMYCDNLTDVVIGASVTTINERAFTGCTSLKRVQIGDRVTTIGQYAFHSCYSLVSVVIGKSVNIIEEYVFLYCNSLKDIEVDEDNKVYASIDGDLYNKDCSTLIRYAIGKEDTKFVIPDCVTAIGDRAFYDCDSLRSVVIPNSVITIGDSAFYDCKVLTSVQIGDGTTKIGNFAFRDCKKLESVVIGKGVTTIGLGAFHSCSGLIDVFIPDGVVTIGDAAFYGCNSLTSVVIPTSVQTIGQEAFYSCGKLKSINYRGTKRQWLSISKGAYWDKGTGNYKITYNY